MDDLAPLPIGRRVAAFRKLRGLTQSGLAARLHRSESWVTKIERGERRIDSLSVLDELSRALAVPLDHLTGHSDVSAAPVRGPDLAELRRVLARPAIACPTDRVPRPLAELHRDVAELTAVFTTATHHVSAVMPRLADRISEGQATVRAGPVDDRPGAHAALAELYRIAASALRHSGDISRARVASDRSLAAAEQSGDPLRVGAAAAFHCVHLATGGDRAAATEVASTVADLVARDPLADTPAGAVVLGALYGYGAMAAAGAGDTAEARRLLKAGHRTSEALGQDRAAFGVHFGPVNLASKEMAVLAGLDRPREAVNAVDGLRTEWLGATYRTGHHCVLLAAVHSRCGDDDRALVALATGLRRAPEVVRYHYLARELVRGLLHRRRNADELLRRVARDLNLPD
jgi:transcriptional regulator with XRE-family HTH domain